MNLLFPLMALVFAVQASAADIEILRFGYQYQGVFPLGMPSETLLVVGPVDKCLKRLPKLKQLFDSAPSQFPFGSPLGAKCTHEEQFFSASNLTYQCRLMDRYPGNSPGESSMSLYACVDWIWPKLVAIESP